MRWDDPRDSLEDLQAKYAEMLAMRLAHDAGRDDEALVRARMARLASRFPGALRETDDMELAEVRRRIAALKNVITGKGEPERWMDAVARFHALARGALCAKKWLRGRKRLGSSVDIAYSAAAAMMEFPEEARAWAGRLSEIASPPRGRVSDAVLTRVAVALEIDEREARRLVFGAPRRERQR